MAERRAFHPVSAYFPLMSEPEIAELTDDIRRNGLQEPIWLHPNGEIIDGRNRFIACERARVEPEYRTWDEDGSLLAFVWSLNGARRHLTPGQKAAVAAEMLPALEAEARERNRLAGERFGKGSAKLHDPIPETGRSDEQAAALVGVSPRYVSEAKALKQQDPERFEKVKAGDITLQDAKRQLKEERRENRREENRRIVTAAPTLEAAVGEARFATIVIDPPWDWGDEGDVDQLGRARPTYATMSIDEVRALPIATLADEDCHLYLWITNRSLPKGFALLEAWGFRYVTCLTWCKPSFGMGNYFRGQTEHVLFGVRGSQMLKRKDAGTWFAAPRGPRGHSSKPTEFYALVESCSPGPYLEVLAREQRDGWVAWGAEVNDAA
jgi:N6-adenosine-specific RNA methylase IME4